MKHRKITGILLVIAMIMTMFSFATMNVAAVDGDLGVGSPAGTVQSASGGPLKGSVNVYAGDDYSYVIIPIGEADSTATGTANKKWPDDVSAKVTSGLSVTTITTTDATGPSATEATLGETAIDLYEYTDDAGNAFGTAFAEADTPHDPSASGPAAVMKVTPGANTGKTLIEITITSSDNSVAKPVIVYELTIDVKAAPKAAALAVTMTAGGDKTASAPNVKAAATATDSLVYTITDAQIKDVTTIMTKDSLATFTEATVEDFTTAVAIEDSALEAGKYLTIYDLDSDGKVAKYKSFAIKITDLRVEQVDPTVEYIGTNHPGKGDKPSDPIKYDLAKGGSLDFAVDFGLTGEGKLKYDDLTTGGTAFKITPTGANVGTTATSAMVVGTDYSVNTRGELVIKPAFFKAKAQLWDEIELTLTFKEQGSDPTVEGTDLDTIIIYVTVLDSSGYTIKGEVKDSSGSIEGAKVQLINENEKKVAATVYTDKDGKYSIKAVMSTDPADATNTYNVKVGAPGYTTLLGASGLPVHYVTAKAAVLADIDVTLVAITTDAPSATDIIVYSDEWYTDTHKIYANLTTEELELDGFTPTYYSLDGGNKWKALGKKTLDEKTFQKLLTKGMTLSIANGTLDKATKKPTGEAITFSQIAARPKLDKYIVNYAPKSESSGTAITATNEWRFTMKGASTSVAAADGTLASNSAGLVKLEFAEVSKTNPKLPGTWGTADYKVNSIEDGKKVYFVRIQPRQDATTDKFIPGSLAKNYKIACEIKAPKASVNKDGLLKYSAGTFVKIGDAATATLMKEKGEITLTNGQKAEIQIAATAKKPASVKATVSYEAP